MLLVERAFSGSLGAMVSAAFLAATTADEERVVLFSLNKRGEKDLDRGEEGFEEIGGEDPATYA